MAAPDPLARSRPWAAALLGVLFASALHGCATTPVGGSRAEAPPTIAAQAAVEMRGQVRGPVPGVGESAEVHVVARGDGAVWASFRRDGGADPPIHEVLIWTTDLALLFDRITLKSTELGAEPGALEAWGARFWSDDALWVLAGLRAGGGSERTRWERTADQWRGRRDEAGLRRPVTEPLPWTETVWRDPSGNVHRLEIRPESYWELPDGRAWPRRLGLEGTDLEARLVVEWEEILWHPALGDSILDPLWEPPRP